MSDDSGNSIALSRRTLLAALGANASVAFAAPLSARPTIDPSAVSALPAAWREAESIALWQGALPGGGMFMPSSFKVPATFIHSIARPELKIFRPRSGNRGALLVIPGGGYGIVSIANEGVDIAERMTAAGYTVFVLLYRLPGEGWGERADVPLIDAQRAMRVIRANAVRYRIDAARVAAIGFSAGGHLAASLATGFAERLHAPIDATDEIDARPVATGLVYPVITLKPPYAHAGSAAALLGPRPDAALIDRRSPELHVTGNTPPVFLTHAVDDGTVPMQNSIMMLEAMTAASRPVEAHFFPSGGHGFGVGAAGSRSAEWVGLFTRWLGASLPA